MEPCERPLHTWGSWNAPPGASRSSAHCGWIYSRVKLVQVLLEKRGLPTCCASAGGQRRRWGPPRCTLRLCNLCRQPLGNAASSQGIPLWPSITSLHGLQRHACTSLHTAQVPRSTPSLCFPHPLLPRGSHFNLSLHTRDLQTVASLLPLPPSPQQTPKEAQGSSILGAEGVYAVSPAVYTNIVLAQLHRQCHPRIRGPDHEFMWGLEI